MYIYLNIYKHIYAGTYMYILIYIYVHKYLSIYLSISLPVYLSIYLSIIYIYIYVCIYICAYISKYKIVHYNDCFNSIILQNFFDNQGKLRRRLGISILEGGLIAFLFYFWLYLLLVYYGSSNLRVAFLDSFEIQINVFLWLNGY